MAGTATPILNLPKLPAGSNAAQPFGTLPVAPANTGISSGLSTKDGSHTLVGDFKDTYGAGVGTVLADTLAGLGTSTDKAVTSTNQSILDAAGRQEANLRAGNAAHGISTDSSASALSLGDFAAQTEQTIASTDASIELSQEDLLINSLFKEGTAHGGDVSGWDTFMNIVKGVGSTVGDIAGAFIGDPKLGNQVTASLPGGNSGPDVASGASDQLLFNSDSGNELQMLGDI